MPLNPNTENYTVPGGIALYFNDGIGERHLGNIVEVDLEPGNEELEHYSNLSGKRLKDKTLVIEEKWVLNFTFDEVNVENWKLFFRGGSITNIGEANPAVTDVVMALAGTGFVSIGLYYGLASVVVRQFIDKCLLYDGAAYIDNTLEADIIDGVPFLAMEDAADYFYIGKATQFKEVYFDLSVVGNYGSNVVWEYWNGTVWAAIVDGAGAGQHLEADGPLTHTPQAGWATTVVNNSASLYYLRASAAAVTTPAQVNHIRQNLTDLTDYHVDVGVAGATGRRDGRVARLAAGKLVDGEQVKVSFTHTTWTSQKMAFATLAAIEGSSRLEVQPAAGRGHRFDIVFGRCNIKSRGAVSFNDQEWLKGPMQIEVLDNHAADPTYPYGYIQTYGVAV